MRRTNEGGSVLSFIMVGVVLVVLLVGAVYFIRQQTSVPPPVTAQKPVSKPQSQPVAKPHLVKPTPVSTPETAKNDTPVEEPASPIVVAPTLSTPPRTLPQTGSADAIWPLVDFGVLGGLCVAYARSCRAAYRPL